ncbi:hypothetical protein IWX83_001368 [Flavobacterium sp. CG_9.1]|nr:MULTISPECIES: hypothetical protein [Flavobacterium]MBG6061582.1 hypothetical protein [Flavobacterium sp. CG_9.1]
MAGELVLKNRKNCTPNATAEWLPISLLFFFQNDDGTTAEN